MKHNMANMTGDQYNMIESVMQDALEDLELRYESYDNELENIEFEARDGFFPFTEGGLIASVFASNSSMEGGGTQPSFLTDYIESLSSDFEADWLKDNPSYDFNDDPDFYYDSLSDYMGFTFFDVRVQFYAACNNRNESGEDELYVSAGCNVDEYGRDNLRDTLKACTLKLEGLTQDKFKEAVASMLEALEV